ncbi:MAG: TnpV protein [Bacilli bacterium]|nr:TnpV protein [Bacilli bacterium]
MKVKYIVVNNDEKQLNKYGLLKLVHIKHNKKALYEYLLMCGELNNYLFSVGEMAEEKVKILMDNYIKSDEKLSEKNKEINQLEWVQLMNNYKNIAEEIVLNELIYD